MSTEVLAAPAAEPLTVLAVDGNSLLHRAFHAGARTGFRTADGRPAWAVRGLLSQLAAAVERACADVVVVGFDDRHTSVRRERWPVYKAQRPDKPASLHEQLDAAIDAMAELGVSVVVPAGLEADDVLASVAAQAARAGHRTVLTTSDRDSFALVDAHTRLLRVIDGGVEASPLLDPERLVMVTGVRPEQYPDLAALRGDASDNLPGVRGFGAKTAARLLAALDTAPDAFADAARGGERCHPVVGRARTATLATDEAREVYALNREVMAMSRTVALDLEGGRVPLDPDRVRTVYARHGLFVNSALRALALLEPAVGEPQPAETVVHRWWHSGRGERRYPPLPPTGPTYEQGTLF